MTQNEQNDEEDYVVGASGPVSEVSHIFEREEIESMDHATASLCGVVRSYGPFDKLRNASIEDLCSNCVRVKERRANNADN